jgi:HAD superfamily hydrolase (TIGR01490 family)
MTAKKAALFDMDRTLVRRDTATLFMRYQRDIGEASWVELLQAGWWVLLYTFGWCDAQGVATKAFRKYAGRREDQFYESCERWYLDYVRQHVTDAGRAAVESHRAAGEVIALVTGALRFAAWPLARDLGIEHVACSEVEVHDGRLTGRPRHLCYGAAKVEAASRVAEAEGFALDHATFYSDSITDLPLLELVGTPVVVNPDSRLRRVALRRGWRIETW